MIIDFFFYVMFGIATLATSLVLGVVTWITWVVFSLLVAPSKEINELNPKDYFFGLLLLAIFLAAMALIGYFSYSWFPYV